MIDLGGGVPALPLLAREGTSLVGNQKTARVTASSLTSDDMGGKRRPGGVRKGTRKRTSWACLFALYRLMAFVDTAIAAPRGRIRAVDFWVTKSAE